jgi:hypothetical protein
MFECCLGVKDTIHAGLKHKEELQRRLDSKSTLGEYCGVLYDCAANFLFDSSIVSNLLDSVLETTGSLNNAEIAEILAFIAKHTPKVSI